MTGVEPAGLPKDTLLRRMYLLASQARNFDIPDEVHIPSGARRVLKTYRDNGAGWYFGERDAALLHQAIT